MLIEILTFSFMKMHLKVSSAKLRPFCLGLNVLNKMVKLVKLHALPKSITGEYSVVISCG